MFKTRKLGLVKMLSLSRVKSLKVAFQRDLGVKKHQSVKKSVHLDSAKAKQITDSNLAEKDNMISVLGKCDESSRNFWLPY